jgi:hypothetical protein
MNFDGPRHAFWLVASMLAVQSIIVLGGVGTCIFFAPEIVAGKFQCDAHNKLSELMAEALAVALAFSTFLRGGPPPPSGDQR